MANIKSQKKRNITNAKAAERNKAIKSELKTRESAAALEQNRSSLQHEPATMRWNRLFEGDADP